MRGYVNNRKVMFDHKNYQTRSRRLNGRKPKPINFEAYASEGNRFIRQVANQLGTNWNSAARITRAVLHALRDRLPPIDAVQFAQGLPMALKGIFMDKYDIGKTPMRIRSKQKFIDFVYNKIGPTAEIDFPDADSVVEGIQAVFLVLELNMSYGQIEQIKHIINSGLLPLFEKPVETEPKDEVYTYY
jgi:uncharacterized protein (DUF2267 family)